MLSSVFFSYIDPGTGSLVLQMLIAGVVGTGVFFRRAVSRLFRRGKEADPASKKNESPTAQSAIKS